MWKVPNEWYRQNMLKEEWDCFKVEWSRKAAPLFLAFTSSLQSPGKLLKMADARVSPQLN